VHQSKVADLNKMVPTDLLKLIDFFEQCQATNKAAGILKKIAKDKKQPKEKKTAHAASSPQVWRLPSKQPMLAIIANLTIIIEMINAMIDLAAMTRTQRSASPTKKG
jgi:hypothetical protein